MQSRTCKIWLSVAAALFASHDAVRAQESNWSGSYAGVNAGYTWGRSGDVDTTSAPVFFAPTWNTELDASRALATGTNSNPISSFAAGGQIGYNWHFSPSFVAGIEADITGLSDQGSSSTRTGSAVPVNYPSELIVSSVTTSREINHLGTVRGRLGYLFGPETLGYVTGGLAFGRTKTSTTISQQNLPISAPFSSQDRSDDELAGWAVGGGFERMLTANISVKAEYLFYDLGTVTSNLPPLTNPGLYSSNPTSKTRYDGNLIRVGINYHF